MAEHTTQTIRADGAPTFDLHIFGNVAWFNVDVLDGCDENAKVTHFMYPPAAPESHA